MITWKPAYTTDFTVLGVLSHKKILFAMFTSALNKRAYDLTHTLMAMVCNAGFGESRNLLIPIYAAPQTMARYTALQHSKIPLILKNRAKSLHTIGRAMYVLSEITATRVRRGLQGQHPKGLEGGLGVATALEQANRQHAHTYYAPDRLPHPCLLSRQRFKKGTGEVCLVRAQSTSHLCQCEPQTLARLRARAGTACDTNSVIVTLPLLCIYLVV